MWETLRRYILPPSSGSTQKYEDETNEKEAKSVNVI
jgi:hypothetical protein